jgi:hypothetical protein
VGTVDNPAVVLEDTVSINDQKKEEVPSEVLTEWLRIEKSRGKMIADRYLENWRLLNKK